MHAKYRCFTVSWLPTIFWARMKIFDCVVSCIRTCSGVWLSLVYWVRNCSFYTRRTSRTWLRHMMLTSIHLCRQQSTISTVSAAGDDDSCWVTWSVYYGCEPWMATNRLKLNADKTELHWAGSNYGSASLGSSGPPIQLRDEIITASNHVRLLGITISSDLNPEKHTSVIVSSCYYWLCQLRKVRRSLDIESAKTIVHAFITSHVDCCNAVLAESQRTLLTAFSTWWMRQLVSSLAPESSTVAWHVCFTLKYTCWTSFNESSINWESWSTGAYKAWCHSTRSTIAFPYQTSPVVNVSDLPLTISWSYHVIVLVGSDVGHSPWQVRWSGTCCLIISVTDRSASDLFDRHWKHSFSQCTGTRSTVEALCVMRYTNQ